MADELDNFRYVEEESCYTGHKISEILSLTKKLKILSGGMTILNDLVLGAVGAIPSTADVGAYARIFNLYMEGQLEAARKEYDRILPLLFWRGQLNHLEASKVVLFRKGIFKNSRVRERRGEPLDDMDKMEIALIMESLGSPC